MKHGIALLLNQKGVDDLYNCQKFLEKFLPNIMPKLGHNINLPHITLIQGQILNIDHVTVLQNLAKYISKHKSELEISSCKIYEDGWIFLLIKPDQLLKNAHLMSFDLVSNKMVSVSDISSDEVKKKLSYYKKKEKEYFLQYGHRYIKETYIPHITLGKVEDVASININQIEVEINKYLANIELTKIHLSKISYHELGDLGSYSKEVLSIEL